MKNPVSFPLLVLVTLYFLASLGHFAHNAEFICEYPKLPAWLTRAQVYGTWAAITSVGVLGLWLVHARQRAAGLLAVAAYASLGFDGLGHYALAPIEFHTFMQNFTILAEVVAAALLLAFAMGALALKPLKVQPSAGLSRHPQSEQRTG